MGKKLNRNHPPKTRAPSDTATNWTKVTFFGLRSR